MKVTQGKLFSTIQKPDLYHNKKHRSQCEMTFEDFQRRLEDS
jgi:hypothetical protein